MTKDRNREAILFSKEFWKMIVYQTKEMSKITKQEHDRFIAIHHRKFGVRQ